MENIQQENIDIMEEPKIDKRKKHTEYASYKEYMSKTKYHTNYYHETKQAINCPICNKPTFHRFLAQHQRSMKCRLFKIETDNKHFKNE